ncbi:MAG: hypothetical protein R6W92_08990 [Desulfocurvibacter africanus]
MDNNLQTKTMPFEIMVPAGETLTFPASELISLEQCRGRAFLHVLSALPEGGDLEQGYGAVQVEAGYSNVNDPSTLLQNPDESPVTVHPGYLPFQIYELLPSAYFGLKLTELSGQYNMVIKGVLAIQ